MTSPKTIVLAGGSGFLGRALAGELVTAGHTVVILSRSSEHPDAERVQHRVWDGKNLGDWAEALEGAYAIVNLTGKSVDCRYTDENKREILASRLNSVHALGLALAALSRPPRVFVQAASLAIYGSPGDTICDEHASLAEGFSPQVCKEWEARALSLDSTGLRKVVLRIGFALGEQGGALGKLAGLTRAFLGGTVGDGRQYISWIHIDDLNAIFIRALFDAGMSGIYNATGPTPVTNAAFMQGLRATLHRPWSPPTPAWAVQIGARLMGTEPELALGGRRCVPARLQSEGFAFRHDELAPALRAIYGA